MNLAIMLFCMTTLERTWAIMPEVSIARVPFQKAVSTDASMTGWWYNSERAVDFGAM